MITLKFRIREQEIPLKVLEISYSMAESPPKKKKIGGCDLSELPRCTVAMEAKMLHRHGGKIYAELTAYQIPGIGGRGCAIFKRLKDPMKSDI